MCPGGNAWMRKCLCARSSRSVCKKKGLVQGRNEQLEMFPLLCAHVESQPNAPFFSRVWQAEVVLSLFLVCFLPVKHSQSVSQENSCCAATVGLSVVALPSSLKGCFPPYWWRNWFSKEAFYGKSVWSLLWPHILSLSPGHLPKTVQSLLEPHSPLISGMTS